ncbi:hypothetical protein [Neobacillus cucumis]|uniref:hypothetical protein n=1 Tax=Neobacillus cucumis TaxID=1740721 RepID=UPI0028535901|nr:hypothetical protein [Neobacillus cucumis]MDR4950352.1 hypothetical protein [Neobacillus cucumis]
MDRQKWGIGGLVFVGCMFIGGGLGSLLGSSQIGWLLGMGVGFLGMALTRLIGK